MKKLFLLVSAIFSLNAIAQLPAYVPSNGLVGWWPFNGNAIDESVNTNDGTVNGATLTTDRFGNANSAYSFNGTNNWISVNNSPSLDIQNYNGITMAGWVKIVAIGAQPHALVNFHQGDGQDINYTFEYSTTGGFELQNYNINAPAVLIQSPTNITVNNWYFIVVTSDFLTNTSKLYLNGQLYGQSNSIPVKPISPFLNIGQHGNSGFWWLNGSIDDIGIWNRALTASEITGLCNGYYGTCVPDINSGLVAHYAFNGNANDISGNNNNGTVNGATLTTDRFGNANSAYSFNGTNNWISVNNSPSLDIQNYNGITMAGWVKIVAIGAQPHALVNFHQGDGQDINYTFEYSTTGGFELQNYNINAPAVLIQSPTNITVNNWYFIVVTSDFLTNTSKLYLNGQLYGQSNSIPVKPISPFLNIGQHGNSGFWWLNGSIDDIRIYNRAINACDVDSLFDEPTNITTKIDENLNANSIKIYPNPSNNKLTINLKNNASKGGYEIKIYNTLSQQVFQSAITQEQFYVDLTTLSGNGIYFVHLIDGEGNTIEIKKIVLQ